MLPASLHEHARIQELNRSRNLRTGRNLEHARLHVGGGPERPLLSAEGGLSAGWTLMVN